jgi:chemotaxis protein methyltransferase CheR
MALPREIVAGLSRRLAERAGLELPAWVVASRAQQRIAALGVAADAYLELVSSPRGAAELAELIETVRVGETRFFRQRAQVDALAAVVVPALAARGKRAVRVWSAGCASGEEPYTLAIVLARLLPEHAITIVATDVSEDALDVAARATYPLAALDHVPDEWLDAFEIAGERARVRPEIARRVDFQRQNLVDGEPPRGCALVWCRNVLIYFAPEARRRAVDKLVGALEPGGFLFVGYSETLRDVAELDGVRAGEAVVYRRREPGTAAPPPPRRTPPAGVPAPEPPALGDPHAHPERVPEAASRRTTSRTLRIAGDCDPDVLTEDLGAAMASPGLKRLTIDLDGADFVPDEVATILRRARAAAGAAGVALELRATRGGTRRWLRRHGLEEDS